MSSDYEDNEMPGTSGGMPAGDPKPTDASAKRRPAKRSGHTAASGNIVETLMATLSPEEFKGYLKGNIIALTLSGAEDSAKTLMMYTKWLNDFMTNGKIVIPKEE